MGKTLLLADDSVTIQKVVGISFASEDIAIKTVDNGDDALHRARELRPDIILADVVMPGMSGYEVCEAVKKDPELRHIPVLLLTGTFEAFDEDRAARAGAAGHIAKPFEAQALVERVKQLLSQPATVASVAPVAPPATPAPARAAAPSAAPAAAPAPSAGGGDNAFDFFDDPVPGGDDRQDLDMDMDGSGDAFAFDEDDLGASTEFIEVPSRPEPAAHTVAILPDDDDAPLAADSLGEALDEAPRTASSEAYDFEFESVGEGAPARARSGPTDDFAESVLMDPAGDSAYDVSSSQLDDLSVEIPAPEPAATQLFDTPPPLQPAAKPQAPGAGPAVAPPSPPPLQPPAVAAAKPPPLPRQDPAPAADSRIPDPVVAKPQPTPAAPKPPPAPEPVEAFVEPEPSWDEASEEEPELPEITPIEDEPEAAPSAASGDSSRVLDEALAQIAPALREQLHETLEKIAWEAFGQVTETVVAQAVERLERVAWEVVPKLAETLIAEEIRKLKDES